MSRRGVFDRNALWLLAVPAGLVLLALSFTLFLIGVLAVVVPWLVIVHEQRDKVAAKWADELSAAGLKRKNQLLTAVNVRVLADNQQLQGDYAAVVKRLAEVLDEHALCPAPVQPVVVPQGRLRSVPAQRDGSGS
jgi:hypothetical protein